LSRSGDGAGRPIRRTGRRWNTITARTIGVAVAAALITAVVTLAVSLAMIRTTLVEQARATLVSAADIAAATLQNPRPGAVLRLNDLLALQDVRAFVVGPRTALPEGVPEDVAAPLLRGESVSTTISVDGATILIEGRPVGSGGVLLAADAAVSGELSQPTFQRLLLSVVVGLAVAVLVALFAGRRVTRPLRRAADGAEQLVAGRRDVTVPTDGPTEVAEIADVVNRLAAALDLSEGRQRDFLLSVSHELRTPLTAVAGYAEALADGVVTGDDTPRTGALMLAESRRLERLVTDLLDLSRLGASELRVERKPTDLRALVAAAGTVWGDRCEREGVRLRVDLPRQEVVVTTDADRVRQIIDNLAENALRVTPADGLIVLALRSADTVATVEVRDSGPGLTDQDFQEAFEPGVLYSRYRGVRPVSSGVGLALVGRLADRLGGSASAGTAPEGGAAFTVRLPLAPPHDP
jgi:two-component system sensor histidine kinase BaeS